MGCATSKQKDHHHHHQKLCPNCQARYTPSSVKRSYSLHSHHHLPEPFEQETETIHVVGFPSSTLGSLINLDLSDHKHFCTIDEDEDEDFSKGIIDEAKTWSETIDRKIKNIIVPKTPTGTPPGEPETIDVSELMAGLENTSPLSFHIRSFSFNLPPPNRYGDSGDHELIKPIWVDSAGDESDSTSIESEFDPDVIATFRKALEDLPPAPANHFLNEPHKNPIVKEKMVVYYTSLRTVRKTYDDCCSVRLILKGLKLKIDERDVSMHSGFKDELKELLGNEWFKGGGLPKVFIGAKCIGGAEEIRRMDEEGELEEAVEGCERVEEDGGEGGNGGGGGGCEGCGDVRFVPCEKCSGSCKIYYEEDEEDEYGFQRCPDCNENGLIRCPICCRS